MTFRPAKPSKRKPTDPIGWITAESLARLARGGNDSRGSVPIHANRSATARFPLYLK